MLGRAWTWRGFRKEVERIGGRFYSFEMDPFKESEMRFKKVMGTTIYQYLVCFRIELLAQYLTTTDRPLLDLAYEVGLKDGSNISRIFKKYNIE